MPDKQFFVVFFGVWSTFWCTFLMCSFSSFLIRSGIKKKQFCGSLKALFGHYPCLLEWKICFYNVFRWFTWRNQKFSTAGVEQFGTMYKILAFLKIEFLLISHHSVSRSAGKRLSCFYVYYVIPAVMHGLKDG